MRLLIKESLIYFTLFLSVAFEIIGLRDCSKKLAGDVIIAGNLLQYSILSVIIEQVGVKYLGNWANSHTLKDVFWRGSKNLKKRMQHRCSVSVVGLQSPHHQDFNERSIY